MKWKGGVRDDCTFGKSERNDIVMFYSGIVDFLGRREVDGISF
jgi:hypothetical protein